jgi:hypothetical protein
LFMEKKMLRPWLRKSKADSQKLWTTVILNINFLSNLLGRNFLGNLSN